MLYYVVPWPLLVTTATMENGGNAMLHDATTGSKLWHGLGPKPQAAAEPSAPGPDTGHVQEPGGWDGRANADPMAAPVDAAPGNAHADEAVDGDPAQDFGKEDHAQQRLDKAAFRQLVQRVNVCGVNSKNLVIVIDGRAVVANAIKCCSQVE